MNARRRRGYIAVAVAAVGATLLVTAAPSEAAGRSDRTTLTLTLSERGAAPNVRTLTCSPDGGSHPRAATVCAELEPVSGHISALPEQQGACMELYRPATLTATGRWKGRQVKYRRTFPNRCNARLRTADVFNF
jgi:hypothetical protein